MFLFLLFKENHIVSDMGVLFLRFTRTVMTIIMRIRHAHPIFIS